MNMTMQKPLLNPFYMDTPRLPLPIPWSSNSFHLPSSHQQQFPSSYSIPRPLVPFGLPQQRNLLSAKIPSPSSYSNTRYHHLKQSASYSNRRPTHQSLDTSTRPHRHSTYNDLIHRHQYRPSKTKSISDFKPISQFNSTPLPKAHSWHTMTNHRQSNLSVVYANEMQLTPKRRRKHSPQKKKKIHPQRNLSSSPKRKPSFNNHRKRSIRIPKRGVVRISTLDEMPVANDQTHIPKNSINNDRLSMKGSISNLSKRQIIPKDKSKRNTSIKNQKNQNNDEASEEIRIDSDIQSSSSSSSSSNHSRLSLQQRLNGSLRNDPLIIAAMENYRQLRRSSSQTTSLTRHRRDLSRDSLRSNSTFRSSSSSSTSHSHSQSSFTSVERSEIRQLIKTIKTKDPKSSNISLQSSPIPTSIALSEESITTNSHPLVSMRKPKKSSITEELDREFNKLRALDPNQELTYVTPSTMCKRKKTNEKPAQTIPPLPTFDELLRQVQLRPIDKPIKPVCFKERPTDDNYENPLSSIPVPRSSPIPMEEIAPKETKHEYAIPLKKTEEKPLPQISHFQPMRNFKFNKSIPNIIPEKRASRSLSMLNWFHNGLTNPFPTTFQPNRIIHNPNEYGTMNVKENIYTSDIDVYLPSSIIDKNENDSLQIHLDNQTILTDDVYSDYGTKKTGHSSSSILNDFSHLFTRKHKYQNKLHTKNQRCSIM